MAPLDGLFKPRSVAVIGASPVAGKPGNNVVRHLLAGGFRGDIWPVNPRGGRIGALDCYASVEDLPGVPDIAFLAVPAGAVEDVLAKCAAAGVGVAVIGASGFAELGSEAGRARQARLAEIARASGMRLLGPNTNGLVSAPEGLALGFNVCFPEATRAPGGVSIVSHSGALFDAVSRRLARSGAGLSRFVAVGNEADITLTEIVAWLATDPATAVIGLVVEALDDGARFRRRGRLGGAQRQADRRAEGRADARRRQRRARPFQPHGRKQRAPMRRCLREAGVASVGSVEGFAAACALLALTPDWRPAREPLLCVSTSGAGGALVVDAATELDCRLPARSDGGWSEPAGRALSALSPPRSRAPSDRSRRARRLVAAG